MWQKFSLEYGDGVVVRGVPLRGSFCYFFGVTETWWEQAEEPGFFGFDFEGVDFFSLELTPEEVSAFEAALHRVMTPKITGDDPELPF